MKIIRFNVEMDGRDGLKRVIDIPAENTFEDLHNAILSAVDFDNSQLASFYICDDDWNKALEITLIDMETEDAEFTPVMRDTKISEYISQKGQKIIYEYDFALLWKFAIEVADTYTHTEKNASYPLLVASEGEAPHQYETIEDFAGISDEDSVIIKHLASKNREFFTGEEDEDANDFGDGYDEDDLDGLGDDFGHGSYRIDEDY